MTKVFICQTFNLVYPLPSKDELLAAPFEWLKKMRGIRLRNFAPHIKHLRACLLHMQARYLLLGGNVEKPLKALFASYLDTQQSWSYVMDKRFGRHEVDLLSLKNGVPQYTIEFKCTFAKDPSGSRRAAINALLQAKKNMALVDAESNLNSVPTFIIHFLNHATPDLPASGYPYWIRRRFPKSTNPMTSNDLKSIYQGALGSHLLQGSCSSAKILSPEHGLNACALDAVIIQIHK